MYVPVNGGTSEFNVARKHCPTKLRRLGAKKSWIFKLEYDTKKTSFRCKLAAKIPGMRESFTGLWVAYIIL